MRTSALIVVFASLMSGCGAASSEDLQSRRAALDAGGCEGLVDFVGDFETGSLSQWTTLQKNPNASISEQFQALDGGMGPVRQGDFSGRFVVRPGDLFNSTASERSAARLTDTRGGEGDSYYLAWSTYFPAGWAPTSSLRILKVEDSVDVGPFDVYATANSVQIHISADDDILGTQFDRDFVVVAADAGLTKDVWHDFLVHVRWSHRPDAGQLQVWHRTEGEVALRPVAADVVPTLHRHPDGGVGAADTLLVGILRTPAQTTDVVVHDGLVRSASLCGALSAFPGGAVLLPDGGIDDGTAAPDSGTTPDGGALDGGGIDGGVSDAGTTPDAAELAVACACSADNALVLGTAALLAAAVRKRRRPDAA